MASDNEQGARTQDSWWRRVRALPNDDPVKTVAITMLVAFMASVLVAGSAVLLRPYQISNKEAERRKHVEEIISQLQDGEQPATMEKQIKLKAQVVNLESGEYLPDVDPNLYDQRQAARDPIQSVEIPADRDLAGLKRRARFAVVYLAKQAGKTKLVILPVRGQGFGSMLYGYLGLANDLNTVVGLTFYELGETPGLGSLIDSAAWKNQRRGKKIRVQGVVQIGVGSTKIQSDSPEAAYQVDALTGATWTARGVTNLLHYWLGQHGFGPYLGKLKRGLE